MTNDYYKKIIRAFNFVLTDEIFSDFFLNFYLSSLKQTNQFLLNMFENKMSYSGITEVLFENFLKKYFYDLNYFLKEILQYKSDDELPIYNNNF